MANFKKGQKFDDYKLIEFIGIGSTAEVWKVIDKEKKEWALKIIAPSVGLDPIGRKEFKMEYDKTNHLDHPNILIAEKYGEFKNRPYLLFELCESSLAQEVGNRYLKAQKIEEDKYYSEEELADIIAQVASALAYLHSPEINMAHLDVKPANVLITIDKELDEKYVLSDFGITAELKRTVMKQTQKMGDSGVGLSPLYASPEQFKVNYEPQSESDIFALGVSIYELATGKLPASGRIGIGQQLINGGDAPRLPGNYSKDFKDLIQQCMNTSPTERPTAEQLQSYALYFQNTKTWISHPSNSTSQQEPNQNSKEKTVDPNTKLNDGKRDNRTAIIGGPRSNIGGTSSKKFKWKPYAAGMGILALAIFGFLGLSNGTNTTNNHELSGNSYFLDGDLIAAQKEYKLAIQSGNTNDLLNTRIQNIEQLDLEYIRPFKEKRAAVNDGNGWGFINEDGQLMIACNYQSVSDFKSGLAVVQKNDLVGIIDLNGKIKEPIKYQGTISIQSGTHALQKTGKTSNKIKINH